MEKKHSSLGRKFLSLFDIKMWKFLLVGVINTLVGAGINFLLLNMLPHITGWSENVIFWLSSATNYVLTSILSYFLNRYFTFKYKEKGWRPVVRFALNIVVCYLLAYGLAKPLMFRILSGCSSGVQSNVATLVGMCFFVGFNYLGQRFFAFRETKKPESSEPSKSDKF